MKYLLFFFTLAFTGLTFSQKNEIITELISVRKIIANRFIGEDLLGNNYYTKENILFKLYKDQSIEYRNQSLGNLKRVDIQNPLKIVLFYEDFNTVVTLDNQLNETQKINFSENPVPIVVAATGMASQNRLWIYNNLTQQIGLYDYLKNDYKVITQSFKGNLKYYQTSFNYFYWIDDQLNWYSCDVFGKILKIRKVTIFDQIQIIDNQFILFSLGDEMFLEDFKQNKKYKIIKIDKTFNNFFYKDQILSIFTQEEITNYKIIIP